MPKIKPTASDAMKADFIAKRGVTKCPAGGRTDLASRLSELLPWNCKDAIAARGA